MSIVSSKSIVKKASLSGYAVGAFNITSIAQMQAVLDAAAEENAPVIIQTSVTPSQLMTPELIAASFSVLAEGLTIPAALHLDHCSDAEYCKRCMDAGYTSIMLDASKYSLEENIRRTSEVVSYAGNRNISIEGELGTVSGVEDQVRVVESEAELCDPASAIKYVNETKVDLFAPAIGTAHGVYKTSKPVIDVDRLKKISAALNDEKLITPLVIHGGTGLSDQIVTELVKAGGAKFNVSTDLKNAWARATAEFVDKHGPSINPVKLIETQQNETKKIVRRWMRNLGCSGRADD